MRVQLSYFDFPTPLDVDRDDPLSSQRGEVEVKEIASRRLAVARFTGFVTDGEVQRQKEALLAALEADGIEVDADPSSSTIPHIILQYNPPYTLPVLRRNEIAVPLKKSTEDESDDQGESSDAEVYEDVSPSDG